MTFQRGYYAVLAIWIVSEMLLARLVRAGAKSGDQNRDQASLRWLWITIIGAILGAAWLSSTDVGTMPEPWQPTLSWASLGFIAGGLAIRWIAILTLRRFFTVNVAIRVDHRLVDSGPYRYIRHPSYTGALLSFVGLGLSFANWLSLALIVLPVTFAFHKRIRIEERALEDGLGDAYRQYEKRTARLVPFVY